MDELDHPVFDADNHYYEALDAFTRHLDPKLGPRCVQWCEIDGRKYHVVGGRVSQAVVNPTFDPIAKAGAMHDYFRGNPDGKQPLEFLREREPIPAEYRDRDARIAKLDEFGLEAVWLFPTLGMLYEELLSDDIDAVTQTFTAFNRWLDDDWGFAYQDRIFAAPYISLCRSRLGDRRARVGARPRRARRRDAPGRAAHRRRSGPGERSAQRPVLGARERGRHHGGRARGRQRLLEQRLRARRFRGRLQRRALAPDREVVPHRARRATTSSSRSCSTSCSSGSRRAGRVGRERRRVPARPVQEAALDRSQDARLLHRGPGRDVPAQRLDQPVLGGRRARGRRAHGRRPGDLRLRLAAHRRACPSRSTTRPSSRTSTTRRSADPPRQRSAS